MLLIGSMKNAGRTRVRAVIGSCWLVLTSVACLPGYEVTSCVPGGEATSCGEVMSFKGRLVVARAEFEGAAFDCDWLVGTDGRRLAVIYPPGWDQRYGPFRLLDPSGRVFAEEGDVLRITYTTGGIGESVCPGEVQAAETVELVDPAPSWGPSAP